MGLFFPDAEYGRINVVFMCSQLTIVQNKRKWIDEINNKYIKYYFIRFL